MDKSKFKNRRFYLRNSGVKDYSYPSAHFFIAGHVAGNLASSLVFSYESSKNTTENNATCGISFCSKEESENINLLVTDRSKVMKIIA